MRANNIGNSKSKPTRQLTYPLLGELTSALVLSVSQEFNDTALIGGKTDNFAGDLADESGAAGRLALGAADFGLGGVERCGFLLQRSCQLSRPEERQVSGFSLWMFDKIPRVIQSMFDRVRYGKTFSMPIPPS